MDYARVHRFLFRQTRRRIDVAADSWQTAAADSQLADGQAIDRVLRKRKRKRPVASERWPMGYMLQPALQWAACVGFSDATAGSQDHRNRGKGRARARGKG